MTVFETVGRGSIPRRGILIAFCAWSAVNACVLAIVLDDVRLPQMSSLIVEGSQTRRSKTG